MPRRRMPWAVILLACLALAGCEGVAFLTSMGPRRVKKIHELPDVSTAVLVDDPGDQLGDSALRGVIAANVRFYCMDSKQFKDVIDPQRVTAMVARHGREFAKMPIDAIGRDLGVEQVIHVSIESAEIATGPGMYRPLANVQVKVVESATGNRIFPGAYVQKKIGLDHQSLATDTFSPDAPAKAAGPGAKGDPRGYRLTVKLDAEPMGNARHADPYILQRRLAEEVGKQVAWLFTDHAPPAVGDEITRAQNR